MIVGRFGENGELFFEIELIAANGERFAVDMTYSSTKTG